MKIKPSIYASREKKTSIFIGNSIACPVKGCQTKHLDKSVALICNSEWIVLVGFFFFLQFWQKVGEVFEFFFGFKVSTQFPLQKASL